MRLMSLFLGMLIPAFIVCKTEPDVKLKPAPDAQTRSVDSVQAIQKTVANVTMSVASDLWPALSDVQERVIPLRVKIENNSEYPLSIRYEEFALVGPEGEHYACLPVYLIEGSTRDPGAINMQPPVTDPKFEYSRFEVLPYYSPAFPGIPEYKGTYEYDPLYNKTYFQYWIKLNLPNREMFVSALPEGVLRPGGGMSGFLFFEQVPAEKPRVTYRADLVNAETGEVFGSVSAPFMVVVEDSANQ